MSADLDLAVLGALALSPALLENCELRSTDFPAGHARETFSAIVAMWEETRPNEIDPIILTERLGGNSAGPYVGSLYDGRVRLDEPTFRGRVALLRKRAVTLRILERIERQAKSGEFDLELIRPDLEEYDRASGGQAFDPMTIMRTGAELQALDININWTVDKLIPEGSLTLLYGPGGGGKTWLSLAIGKAVSEGVPFLDLPTKRQQVVYIDYENPLPVVIDRARKLNVRDVRFWTLADSPGPPRLDDAGWTQYRDLPPGSLLFFDTARSSQLGDENDSKDVALVMSRLKEIRSRGHEIVLQHHTVKIDDKGFKGSTAWSDLADHTLAFHAVRRETLEEIDGGGEPDPNALLFLGTGKKTRYEHSRLYLIRDPNGPGFVHAVSPSESVLVTLADYISGEGAGKNQTELVDWAKREDVGSKMRGAIIGLLNRGEREGRWRTHPGPRGAKIYEPAT